MSSGLIALNLMLHFIERIKSNAFFLIIIKYNAKCIKYNANEFAVDSALLSSGLAIYYNMYTCHVAS